MTPVVAVKCYGFDWLTRYGLSEDDAARRMSAHGVDWAIIQNRLDPLPTSGVEQVLPEDSYDDERFRERLREAGLKTYESSAVYFQPQVNSARPELRPIGSDGREMSMFDWYLGVSPSSRSYLAEREELMEDVVTRLQPDGVFLSFIRFPGFWEAWTPAVAREDIIEYCFSDGSLERFQLDTGIDLPRGQRAEIVRFLTHELRDEWTAWKCSVVEDAVRTLQGAARRARPGTEILINGVAFSAADRGDIPREILGQDLGAISQDAEHIETMVYHQILGRDPEAWVSEIIEELRPQVRGTLLACLQTTATYTEAPHDGGGRSPILTPEDFVRALTATAHSRADGVSIYHWTDILADEIDAGGVMARGLRDFKEGVL